MRGIRKTQERGRALRTLEWCLWALAVAAVSLSLALARIETCDYVSVNGDFQSYNVFRRMLAGQTPYVDFVNYIGMAPVWVNLPLVALNNTFAGSLFATNFTSNILFSVTVLLWVWLITKSRPAAMLASVFLTKFVSSGLLATLFGPSLGGYWTNLFQSLYAPGNSMRIARLFLTFLLVELGLVWLRVKGEPAEGTALQTAFARLPACGVLGALAGAGLLWSSDFGLAAAFCVTVLFLLEQALRLWAGPRAFFARLGVYAAGFVLGLLVCASLVTGFRPGAWLQSLAATGGWQYFYFNGTGGKALLLYVFTTPRLLLFAVPCAAFLIWCLVRLWQKKLTDRQLLLGFAAFTILAATGTYVLSGSGYNFKEALEGYFWLAAFALAGRGLLWLTRRFARRRDLLMRAAAGTLALALIALAGLDAVRWPSAAHNGQYLEALGGYTTYQKALVELPEVTGGEPVFSMYATGLEAVEGTFQPTGCDYIIHALGDEKRAEYVSAFAEGGWAWAQTPRMDLENWLTVQNWDVYRHLWAGYERCYATEYSWLWRACGDRSLPVEVQVSVQRQSGSGWTVTVSAPEGETFTADLYIRWESGFTSAGGAFLSLGRSMVGCAVPLFGDMPGVAGYFPASGEGYIPVRVENGQGTATLWSADENFTELTVTEARLERALPALDLYEQEAAQ